MCVFEFYYMTIIYDLMVLLVQLQFSMTLLYSDSLAYIIITGLNCHTHVVTHVAFFMKKKIGRLLVTVA